MHYAYRLLLSLNKRLVMKNMREYGFSLTRIFLHTENTNEREPVFSHILHRG